MKQLKTLSLRLRIFLFFVFVAVSCVLVVWGALYLGLTRVKDQGVEAGFVFIAIASGFGIVAVCTFVWLLFDENVARPIEKLASSLRAKTFAGAGDIDTQSARFLGDLAPAALDISEHLSQSTLDQARVIAAKTQQLSQQKERLATLLSEMPVAVILVNPAHQIVLYDRQAAELFLQSPLRLNGSIFDYFDRASFLASVSKMNASGVEQYYTPKVQAEGAFGARLKPLAPGEGYLVLIDDIVTTLSPDQSRPVVFDFDLLEAEISDNLMDVSLNSINFVVFDTETTGLLPHKDEVVQIGAVRVVNGNVVPGETLDQLVDPKMKIPNASTKVHGINDAMVAGQPDMLDASKRLYEFSRDAVLVAHNAPFDMAFLRRHAKRSGLNWDHPVLDTVLLSAILFGTTELHSLDAVCTRLGVTLPEAQRHTALGDAKATAEILCKMLSMLQSRGIHTLGEAIGEAKKHRRLLEDLN